MTGGEGIGLLHFVRNDGRSGVLDCFTSFAMTGRGGLDCHASLAMTGGEGLDCHASLAMTGRGETGESKTLKKFEKNCFISLLEYT